MTENRGQMINARNEAPYLTSDRRPLTYDL
jgi:hypothetical protein